MKILISHFRHGARMEPAWSLTVLGWRRFWNRFPVLIPLSWLLWQFWGTKFVLICYQIAYAHCTCQQKFRENMFSSAQFVFWFICYTAWRCLSFVFNLMRPVTIRIPALECASRNIYPNYVWDWLGFRERTASQYQIRITKSQWTQQYVLNIYVVQYERKKNRGTCNKLTSHMHRLCQRRPVNVDKYIA